MLYALPHRKAFWILVLMLLTLGYPQGIQIISRYVSPPPTANNILQASPKLYEKQGSNVKALTSIRAQSRVESPQDIKFENNAPRAGIAVWVGVSGVLADPILQQPEDNAIYVSNKPGYVTQFRQATNNGVTGLLAHNYLSGKEFYNLNIGQIVSVLYSDKSMRHYQVASIHRYQKLIPSRLDSGLLELDSRKDMTSLEVYRKYYQGDHHLVFQTCLEGDGQLNWGLLFVIALPVD